MNPLRQSYEARVLVVPLGESAQRMADTLPAMGLEGMLMLVDATGSPTSHSRNGLRIQPLGSGGWHPDGSVLDTTSLVEAADMVVLLANDLTDVSDDLVRKIADDARAGGDLIAAVLIAPTHWEEASGASAMTTLRQEVDMLVSVRGPRLAAAFLDVLRGGPRNLNPTHAETHA